MNRRIFTWKLRSIELRTGTKTLLMGVLNVTPDSFSDGGRYSDPDRAYARALELEEQGADIIDIGAESTKPGAHRISAEEEWRRLAPVLKRLRDKLGIPISLDTYKAETAQRAFEYGIEIINDPSGLTFDADMAKTVANANAGLILNHMRGTPETWAKLPPLPDMMGAIVRDLEATVSRANRSGVERARIAIDPGLGFGKRNEQNLEVIAHLGKLAALECPIVSGPSRKSFLGQTEPGEIMAATAAAVTASILNGAHIVRVHDIPEMKAVAQVADEIARVLAMEAEAAAIASAERPVPRKAFKQDRPSFGARSFEKSEREPLRPPVPRIVKPVEPPAEAVAEEKAEVPEIGTPEVETAGPPAVEEARPPREARKPFAERAPKRDFGDRPPKRSFSDRPPRRDAGKSFDRPPRREFGDRPPKRDFGERAPKRDFGDRPPRRDAEKAGSGKSFDRPKRSFGDRPPKRDFGDRPPRRDSGKFEGPPKRSFRDRAASDRPTSDRPIRREFSDRPPKRDFGDRPPRRDAGKSFGGPPKRSFGDRPPRRDGDKPSGPPKRDFGGKKPFGNRPSGGKSGGKPGGRPFRKRP